MNLIWRLIDWTKHLYQLHNLWKIRVLKAAWSWMRLLRISKRKMLSCGKVVMSRIRMDPLSGVSTWFSLGVDPKFAEAAFVLNFFCCSTIAFASVTQVMCIGYRLRILYRLYWVKARHDNLIRRLIVLNRRGWPVIYHLTSIFGLWRLVFPKDNHRAADSRGLLVSRGDRDLTVRSKTTAWFDFRCKHVWQLEGSGQFFVFIDLSPVRLLVFWSGGWMTETLLTFAVR